MLTQNQISEISLRNSELYGQMRGKMYGLNSSRDVESEFSNLVDKARYDKGLARFLENHYYMFLDRLEELDISDQDKQASIANINASVNELVSSRYSSKHKALFEIKNQLDKMSLSSTASERLINQNLKKYLDQYT